MYESLIESKLMTNYESINKLRNGKFSKNSNKGTAPKSSDIQNMLKSINKKEGK